MVIQSKPPTDVSRRHGRDPRRTTRSAAASTAHFCHTKFRDPSASTSAAGHHDGVQTRVLGPGDDHVLEAAVSAFRGIHLTDHSPFLTDPATIALAATDGSEVVG